jgi:hypothetical protein
MFMHRIQTRNGNEMATARVIYFSDTTEVSSIIYIRNEEFAAKFPGVKGRRVDSFSMLAGWKAGDMHTLLPVTRVIDYKRNPSLHKCDVRCQHAKGRSCECSCGGKFHGAGANA